MRSNGSRSRGTRDLTTRALAEYLLFLVDEDEGRLGGLELRATDDVPNLLEELGNELDNLRTAVEWALAVPEPHLAIRLALEATLVRSSRGWGLSLRAESLAR